MQSRGAWPQPTLARTLTGVALCLVAALLAQRSLDRHVGNSPPWLPLATLALAGIAFAILTRHVVLEAADRDGAAEPATISRPMIAATVAISVLGCLNFGGNRFRPAGVVLWSGGVLLALLYLWLISPALRPDGLLRTARDGKRLWVPAPALALLAIVLLGAWFRLYLNGAIPLEMGFDLASKYFDSLAIARGEYAIFFPARLGREGLFFYSVALVGRLVGMTKATLHLTSALFGTLTIVAVYFLAQEVLGRPSGLLAAFLLATNRWHIVLSRTGFRAAAMPLCTALALHALIRALRTRRPLDFGWAGVALGMGIYSYRSFLFVPVAIVLGLLLTYHPRQLRALFPGLVVIVLVAAAIAGPLARYVLENPEQYLTRQRYQWQSMEKSEEENPGTLANYVRCLLAFNYRGDGDSRFSVPFARQMGLVSGVLLVLGAAYALWHWRRGYHLLLLTALFVLLLPAALSMVPNDTPSALRLSGAIVPAVVLAAAPVAVAQQAATARQMARPSAESRQQEVDNGEEEIDAAGAETVGVALTVRAGGRRRTWALEIHRASVAHGVLLLTVGLLLFHETAEVQRYYFHDYVARLPEMSNYSLAAAIADEIKYYGDEQSAYIKAWPSWLDSSVVQMHMGTGTSWYPFADTLAPDQPPLSTVGRTALFILHPEDGASLATLNAFFPHTSVRTHTYPDGQMAFYTVLAER